MVLLQAILLAGLLAAGATPAEKTPEPTVWVFHAFIGGPKCVASGPVIHYTAPGFEAEKAKFKKPQIRILREYYRDRATCQACHSCPNYHREIFFEIRAADLPLSEKIGYRKTSAPLDAEELKEYEDSKRYKPKPDVPPESD
jgi:hypothetical protein